jgi:copper chaperone CopZ
MKKIIFIILLLGLIIINKNSSAQITSMTVGVDGFTCSLCAKGVEGQFKSLDFVKSVKTDLKNTLFVLTFKQNAKVDVSQVQDAVTDGGFSVRDIKVEAKGTVKGDPGSGYVLITNNTPDINLSDIKIELSDGEKVSLKGVVNAEVNSISVTSIKKM